MRKLNSKQYSRSLLFTVLGGLSVFVLSSTAQTVQVELAAPTDVSMQKVDAIGVDGNQVTGDYVNITVAGGPLSTVLDMFVQQTGRNVVVGPDVVVSNGVNFHLTNVRWDEALEVILKPYGFGYQKVGETIVVSKLGDLTKLTAVEPLETKVFTLRFLDASDVQEILKGQLSSRGTSSVAVARGMKGWKTAPYSAGSGSGRAASTLGQLARVEDNPDKAERVKSKTLIVTDVPSSLARVGEVLTKLDIMPQQVLVEARFVEVNQGLLKDLGLDAGYTKNNYSVGQIFSTVAPGVFNPASSAFWPVSMNPNNQNAFITKDGSALDIAIRAIQQDKDTKVLSAPRILTLNNQEATIIVGQKYPIIQSQVSGSGVDNTVSTTLDYYENIGIQLNVVPQICDNDQINMIVHPSVSTIDSFQSGKVNTGISTNATALTEYPIINIREAETQILLKNSEIAVIGGLLDDRKSKTQSKVPFLGDIPLLGRLFRRDINDNKTIDLLIFLSATIISSENQNAVVGENGKFATNKPLMATVAAAGSKAEPVKPAGGEPDDVE